MNASYQEPSGEAMPQSYAILSLPSKAEMRKKGFDPAVLQINGTEAHPLSKWQTFSLPARATYKDAVDALEQANSKPWGLLKARINFSDGSMEMYERKDPNTPSSFNLVKNYSPNGVYRQETMAATSAARATLQPRLKHTVDDRGHYTGKNKPPRSFAPENLYQNCPPPVQSQAGYDFTPMSYNAFMMRPHDEPKGVRNVQSNFMHSSTDYRPRAYLREGPATSRHVHCGEVYQVGDYTMDLAHQADVVDQRNRVTEKTFTATGTLKEHSTVVGKRNAKEPRFACSTANAGGTTGAAEQAPSA